jgi:hypothetical protein
MNTTTITKADVFSGSTTPACTLQLATFTLAPVYYSAPVPALSKIASLFCIPQDFLYVICID